MDATVEGGEPAQAARAAAQNRSGAGWSDQASPAIRAYAEWYDWARTTLNLSGESLHHAAAAALAESELGGDAARSAEAARRSAPENLGGESSAAPALDAAILPELVAPLPSPPAATAHPPPPAVEPQPVGSTSPPAHSVPSYGAPTPPGSHGYPPAAHPPPAYPQTYAYGPPAYPVPGEAPRRARVEVPGWVALLIAFFGGVNFSLWPTNLVSVLFYNLAPQYQFEGWLVGVHTLLLFVFALIAVIGVLARARWARVLSIVAGITFCTGLVEPAAYLGFYSVLFAVVGLVIGVTVIVGAALARPLEPTYR